ncbi:MAG: hypothetical protein N4A63_07175 [Vallitalea sp.]|jgi:hypothetical protein|nr:hypothetical protein [Vallitalea sp.]
MNISKLQFKESDYYKQHTAEQKTELIQHFNSVNQEELKTELKTHFRGSIYDKITPINGIDSKTILDGLSNDAQVYLIYIDNSLVYLQKHDPFQIGNVEMTNETIQDVINKHITSLVDDRLMEKVIEKVDSLVSF